MASDQPSGSVGLQVCRTALGRIGAGGGKGQQRRRRPGSRPQAGSGAGGWFSWDCRVHGRGPPDGFSNSYWVPDPESFEPMAVTARRKGLPATGVLRQASMTQGPAPPPQREDALGAADLVGGQAAQEFSGQVEGPQVEGRAGRSGVVGLCGRHGQHQVAAVAEDPGSAAGSPRLRATFRAVGWAGTPAPRSRRSPGPPSGCAPRP